MLKNPTSFIKALDICTVSEKKLVMTWKRYRGNPDEQFADYIMETIAGLVNE